MSKQPVPALPLDFNLPKQTSELTGKDQQTYLQFTTHMVTFYKQTYGELSRFFLALRAGKLLGSQCPTCGQVMVPAATWHCPACNFVEMKEVYLPHRGMLAATAPITIFPSASFIGDAPFCRGYVDIARNAPAASFLPCRLQTTTGLPRPGIFVKGIEVKLVFEDDRVGSIRDIFCVPASELTAEQLAKEPLFASELSFESPKMPDVKRDPALTTARNTAVAAMRKLAGGIERSPRAQKDLGDRTHAIGVKTGGGDFGLYVARQRIRIEDTLPKTADFVMVADDPQVFIRWVEDGSLTDAAVEGSLWLPNRAAFGVLPVLDRLPRSVRRDAR
ncbi:MAG: zinc ribbon domain-containing protein [Acidobacteria bacterium]|nr:zinc ribbon domain-containing protein [Acidobacteriota bacterium]